MKVSISLPDELVRYVDDRVENRSRLIEGLLQSWRKHREKQAMVEACLLLDELSNVNISTNPESLFRHNCKMFYLHFA